MNVALYRQDVVLARSVRASSQVHERRTRLFLRVEDDAVGFGEVAPQLERLHGDPALEDVVAAVRLLARVIEAMVAREGELPSWSRVARLVDNRPADLWAAALFEMALLDREMRASGRDAIETWPENFVTPIQATASLLDDAEWRVAGAARVRVKSAPGPLARGSLERLASLDVPVIVDYNCSVTRDEEVLDQLETIRSVVAVDAVEQPYGVGNLADHARLAGILRREHDVALSLDESVRSLGDLRHVASYEAATLVCVKPARVGGLANARTMIARAGELGLVAYLGGFFESPYARRVHRTLARHAVGQPSDVGEVALVGADDAEATAIAVSFGLEPSAAMLAAATPLAVAVGEAP
jgi:O-succinylbenzoate synthase